MSFCTSRRPIASLAVVECTNRSDNLKTSLLAEEDRIRLFAIGDAGREVAGCLGSTDRRSTLAFISQGTATIEPVVEAKTTGDGGLRTSLRTTADEPDVNFPPSEGCGDNGIRSDIVSLLGNTTDIVFLAWGHVSMSHQT
jgi:hypothetical protein